ncbi:hypothetical protein N7456_010480 [Penicillium angulare]|uniref:Uncharacterized protein n=1 Tax=Penicillium angulare TaxID=116970 RepID=A0A9W9K685_9EURO|nr:hypothetical protein N7456_010480 [Penicillium angulare]
MRFSVASVVLAFASVSSCMHITSPLDNACIDLTQQLEVHWYAEANEVVATPYVSIRLANQRGAWPNVNQPLALDHEYTIPTRQGYVVFPRMSNADAEHFASINNG